MAEASGRSHHFRLEELAPGVHAARSIDGGLGLSNAAIIDLGDITVVFDAMLTPAAGADLRRAAERLTGRRPEFLVNSHYHGDHMRGNVAFAPVRVVSTARTRELIATLGREQLRAEVATAPAELRAIENGSSPWAAIDLELYRGWFRGITETPVDLELVLPDLTFESRLDLHGSRRSVQLITFGGGHSASDVWAYLPDDRIAVLGDLLSNGYHPWLTDGEPFEFERILARIAEFKVDRAVPGHGDVGDHSTIVLVREYVTRMIARARATLQEGTPTSALAGLTIPSPFYDWKFRNAYAENLAFVRRRLPTRPQVDAR